VFNFGGAGGGGGGGGGAGRGSLVGRAGLRGAGRGPAPPPPRLGDDAPAPPAGASANRLFSPSSVWEHAKWATRTALGPSWAIFTWERLSAPCSVYNLIITH
jgi:hypothetical protein